jgi:hypothetical protein
MAVVRTLELRFYLPLGGLGFGANQTHTKKAWFLAPPAANIDTGVGSAGFSQ